VLIGVERPYRSQIQSGKEASGCGDEAAPFCLRLLEECSSIHKRVYSKHRYRLTPFPFGIFVFIKGGLRHLTGCHRATRVQQLHQIEVGSYQKGPGGLKSIVDFCCIALFLGNLVSIDVA
jgi:hypothetical protein